MSGMWHFVVEVDNEIEALPVPVSVRMEQVAKRERETNEWVQAIEVELEEYMRGEMYASGFVVHFATLLARMPPGATVPDWPMLETLRRRYVRAGYEVTTFAGTDEKRGIHLQLRWPATLDRAKARQPRPVAPTTVITPRCCSSPGCRTFLASSGGVTRCAAHPSDGTVRCAEDNCKAVLRVGDTRCTQHTGIIGNSCCLRPSLLAPTHRPAPTG